MSAPAPKRILVWLEARRGTLTVGSQGLAALAVGLSRQGQLKTFGSLLGGPNTVPGLEAFSGLGLHKAIVFKGKEKPTTREEAEALLRAVELTQPDILLVNASERGREIAPLVAGTLGTGLTADCSSLRLENGLLVQTRPAFGGNLIAEIVTPVARPQMATVRLAAKPGHASLSPATGAPGYTAIDVKTAPRATGDLKIIKRYKASSDGDLEKAQIVVACGLGLGGPEGVAKAGMLAGKLGASLGCTRAVVDQGWLPHGRQIGMSGRNVSPSLLIALGVSGSTQFMAGAWGSKSVVAVNSDPQAPIMAMASVGLVLDLESLWPELEERLGTLV